ncbi:nitroreductase family protein [Rhodobacter ferrooxidans]|uniref:Putative NAD(P)H nitroreductase n=1 Tax=Rhodobacter ferrooxidans TaxID=371731 RepID=C8S3A5_9RHOB|nr:nitroreductase family protein [Rhodobacter sp. SW2]EEW24587.1 nitroreductase [Rhodobacter sp. SW2]
MPEPLAANPAALEFLLTRRSRPAKTLALPVPDRDQLTPILTAAARSPDHGKLEPWRFIVLERPALQRLAALAQTRAEALGLDESQAGKGVGQFAQGNLAVVVVASPKPSDKVPQTEQLLSAGAVSLALLNAALASGWGACWLTGWPAHDRGFVTEGLGLAPQETVAGFIHIGSETAAPPDRPRPDLASLITWASA